MVYGQGAHSPASHRKRANGETSDGERTDCSGPQGERAECDRTKTERAIRAYWALLPSGVASRRLDLANFFLIGRHVAHGAPCFAGLVLCRGLCRDVLT